MATRNMTQTTPVDSILIADAVAEIVRFENESDEARYQFYTGYVIGLVKGVAIANAGTTDGDDGGAE